MGRRDGSNVKSKTQEKKDQQKAHAQEKLQETLKARKGRKGDQRARPRTGDKIQQPDVTKKDDLTKDISRGLSDLRTSLPQPMDEGTPAYLRTAQTMALKDGTSMKVSDEGIKAIQKALLNADHNNLKWDTPVVAGGCLFLPNRDNQTVRWVNISDIPQGNSKANNFWIHKQGNTLEVRSGYPENEKIIAQEWREKTGKPMIDLYGNEPKPDARLKAVNQSLNRDVESLLKKGRSLGDALETVRKSREEVLRVLLMGYVDAFAIFSAYGLSTPSVSSTYQALKRAEK